MTRLSAAFLPALLLLGLACASPVGVERVDDQTAQRELTRSVLSDREPSSFAKAQLLRLGLWERYREAPDEALQALRAGLEGPFQAGVLFALAELSFDRARHTGRKDLYLASAVYAYAFAFPEDGAPPDRFDARTRIAMDLYNHALGEGLAGAAPDSVELHAGVYPLPFGTLRVELDLDGFRWGQHQLAYFTRTSNLELRGLRNRYRLPGIGAALAAQLDIRDEPVDTSRFLRIPPGIQVPATALLRIERPRAAVASGHVRGRLQLYANFRDPFVELGGQRVPLEYEPSVVLALLMNNPAIWKFELRGYLSGAYKAEHDGLYALSPYRPGRIPLVLVHGTASSPGRWAQMLNELAGDPLLRTRYQPWLFMYNTGNPILYSAVLLRDALNGAVQELDPEGRDPALREMVVVGHSQGGLLTRLVATDSGDAFWNAVSRKPLSELDLAPETRSLFHRAFFFEHVPYVKRVVFICTPHRGSFLAGRRLGALAARLVRLPLRLASLPTELIANQDALVERSMKSRIPSSVDNMNPRSAFTRVLAASSIAPGIAINSIVAVKDGGPPYSGKDDGVVAYDSAHLANAESELVVHSGHSTQGEPATIEEVRRILRLHLETVQAP